MRNSELHEVQEAVPQEVVAQIAGQQQELAEILVNAIWKVAHLYIYVWSHSVQTVHQEKLEQ